MDSEALGKFLAFAPSMQHFALQVQGDVDLELVFWKGNKCFCGVADSQFDLYRQWIYYRVADERPQFSRSHFLLNLEEGCIQDVVYSPGKLCG